MISLLIEGWFEPPAAKSAHFSTLVQQILSFVSQNGGANIGQLYSLLCSLEAPFDNVAKDEFVGLIRHMGLKELLMQASSGLLLHGRIGEKFVNHYTFYAAFATEEEYRIASGSKTLGTLPISQSLAAGQRILFGGKTWTVEDVDESLKTVFVVPARGGTPPLFDGGGSKTHTKVRQRMRELLDSSEVPGFLDSTAKRFLSEGRANFAAMELPALKVLDQGNELLLLTWLGDSANEALAWLLGSKGYVAQAAGPGVEVIKRGASIEKITSSLHSIATEALPPLNVLLPDIERLQREKWDWVLPDDLIRKGFTATNLNLTEAKTWAVEYVASASPE
jgi:ATP-dependent Lhr-like helicase